LSRRVTGDVSAVGKLIVEPFKAAFTVETLRLSVLWNLSNTPLEEIVALPECVCDWLEYSEFDAPIPHFHHRPILGVDTE